MSELPCGGHPGYLLARDRCCGLKWTTSLPVRRIKAKDSAELAEALNCVEPNSQTDIVLTGTDYVLESFISPTNSAISIIGDRRHVVGMSYINGAQEDWAVRLPFPFVYEELGGGSDCRLTFTTNTITVEFVAPSALDPAFFPPRNPDLSALTAGDRIRVFDPVSSEAFEVTVASVSANVITLVESNVLPPVVLGTTIALVPRVTVGVAGSPCQLRIKGTLSLRGLALISPLGSPLFLGSRITSVENCLSDVDTIIFNKWAVLAQPNTWWATLQFDTGVNLEGCVQSFIGRRSGTHIESNPFSILFFSNWVCSNNEFENQPNIPKAALTMVNSAQLCLAYNSFIKCPTNAIVMNTSEANIQHAVFDECAAAVTLRYNSKISSEPLHRLAPPVGDNSGYIPIFRSCGVGVSLIYSCMADIPGVKMSGNGLDLIVDGIDGMLGPQNNWPPYIGFAPPPSPYGSVVYHTSI